MNGTLSIIAGLLVKLGIGLLIANEVRGFIMAAPVLFAMYASGGSLMAVWLGVCSLAGIALSVIVPLLAARKLNLV